MGARRRPVVARPQRRHPVHGHAGPAGGAPSPRDQPRVRRGGEPGRGRRPRGAARAGQPRHRAAARARRGAGVRRRRRDRGAAAGRPPGRADEHRQPLPVASRATWPPGCGWVASCAAGAARAPCCPGRPAGYAAANAASLHDRAGGTWPLATHWVSGGVLSLPAARFAEVGGFSPDLFLYFEDVDLCARLAERYPAMRIVVPDVPAGIHDVGGSGRGDAGHHRPPPRGQRGHLRPRPARRRVADRRRGHRSAGGAGSSAGAPRPTTARRDVAAIVSLGRDRGMGERRRVESWAASPRRRGSSAGRDRAAARDHRAGARPRRWPCRLVAVAAGPGRGRDASRGRPFGPAGARALRPRAARPRHGSRPRARRWPASRPLTVLDLVDRLDRSYRGRAGEADGLRAWLGVDGGGPLGRAVPSPAARDHEDLVTVLAGYEDAAETRRRVGPQHGGAPAAPGRRPPPDHDVLFFGNLSYPPNVAALRPSGLMWPDRCSPRRPGTTVLVAGAHPTDGLGTGRRGPAGPSSPHFDDSAELCAAAASRSSPRARQRHPEQGARRARPTVWPR